ncbi:hypothetical protein [Ruminococcus sp. Marseille-P6503]|uniref:hypothetical protein n=1 Tax=Ruminococcus sp. Marseille-P6503 TaxID=2364796 RepID=UPI000F52E22D|nr:hypothetical protein [Ruminococcus sp. Marseille-P6503]
MGKKKRTYYTSADYSDKFIKYLDGDECILWTGKKEIKSNLESRLLGLGIAAFAALWTFIVYSSGNHLAAIIALPIAVIGLLMILGIDSDYYYAVTDKRIISFLLRKPASVYYEDIFSVELTAEADDTGTIMIKSRNHMLGFMGGGYSESPDYAMETKLEYVYDSMTAYKIISERASKFYQDSDDIPEYTDNSEQP